MSKRIIAVCLIAAVMLLSVGCSSRSDNSDPAADRIVTADSSDAAVSFDAATDDMFTDRDMETGYDEENAVLVSLEDTGVYASDPDGSVSSSVEISDGRVTITGEGTYILRGSLTDGMIIVDTDKSDKVQLVLDGVDITSSTSAAIYVRQADKVFVTTAAGTVNNLTNGGEYIAIDENNIDAVIFSKEDLTLNGEGTLIIDGEAGHGIVSKDDLAVTGGTYEISAGSHGLSGKDSVRIAGGTFAVTAGTDGIHAENDDDDSSDLGFVYIAGGAFVIDCADDGIHADNGVTINGGSIDIVGSYEGIEGLTVDINGGEISIVSSDDGLNAAGGRDSSGFGGFGRDTFMATEGAYIRISGGTITVNADGDGIDSNGDLYVDGGDIYISGPVNSANGAIDYEGTAVITGGTVVAAGALGMAQNFGSSSTQGSVLITAGSGSAGDDIILADSDGNVLISWQSEKSYACVVISCSELTEGDEYTLQAGSEEITFTMDSLIYSTGGSGMGGMTGGMPGSGGGGMQGGGFGGGAQNNSGRSVPGGGRP